MADVGAYLDLPYTKVVTRDEDGVYVAEVRELPGCVAHGDSETDALVILREAQASWIQGVLEQGKQPPLPATELPSGKWLQRVPRSLHRKLADLAEAEGTSLNQLVTALLAEAVARRAPRTGARPHDGWDAPTLGRDYKWKGPNEVSSRFTDPLREAAHKFEAIDDPHMRPEPVGSKR